MIDLTPGRAPTPWMEGLYRRPPQLPAFLFVSRNPAPGDSIVPGLGPRGRTLATGGRLYIRTAAWEVRPFLTDERFFDVADPAVSWDGKRVAFAATVHRDSAWRIWTVDARGRGLTQVTRTDPSLGRERGALARHDDFDPTWLPDGTLCFASTRYPQIAGDGRPASNLFAVAPDGSGLRRLTSERHGAEEPTVDPRNGLIVFARWWRNRFRASERTPSGITLDPTQAVPGETVDLWHAISIDTDGNRGKLAGGHPRIRDETAAYQPCVLANGTLVGVRATPTSLIAAVNPWIQAFPGGFAPARWVPGVPVRDGVRRPVRACAPAVVNDQRLLIAADVYGDFGIVLASAAAPSPSGDEPAAWSGPEGFWLIEDFPGTHELDPVVLAPRRLPPVRREYLERLPMSQPPRDLVATYEKGYTFRFDCMNVFENAPVDVPIPDAPVFEPDVRMRFFAALARPEAQGGDTAILVREADVQPAGGVHEDGMPSDLPMFEQLISAHGGSGQARRVLRVEDGPAHVPGFNATRYGVGTRCVGCHRGHSAIAVPSDYYTAQRFNLSPSARVKASSIAPGTAGAQAAVDRRARGNPGRVGWIAESNSGEWIRLEWQTAIEVDTLILYALAYPRTDLRVREVELALFQGGRPVATERVRTEVQPRGTRIPLRGQRMDALEVRPLRCTGTVDGQARVGIAEIETRARIAFER